MRIAQVIRPGASEYERKCQRVDQAGLADVVLAEPSTLRESGAAVAHVYGPVDFDVPLPYVASELPKPRWWRKPKNPAYRVTPLKDGGDFLPEAVEDVYFSGGPLPSAVQGRRGLRPSTQHRVGTFRREAVVNVIHQTLARIHRFRDDVAWEVFDHPPLPEELAALDLWVDPAIADDDFDGFVAEALVLGQTVVASRTPINSQRLEGGRTGFLVPPRDANELAHAILSALFKPERAHAKNEAARQALSKFRPRQRLRVLTQMYESAIR